MDSYTNVNKTSKILKNSRNGACESVKLATLKMTMTSIEIFITSELVRKFQQGRKATSFFFAILEHSKSETGDESDRI